MLVELIEYQNLLVVVLELQMVVLVIMTEY